jgi:capsular exopolysaccharide synthesis family protein
MDLRGYITFLRRRWWLLIIGPLIACSTAYFVTQEITPEYRATAQIFVQNQSASQLNSLTNVQNSQSGLNNLQVEERLTNTYVRLIERRPGLEAVITALGLPISVRDLQDKLSVSGVEDTQLILVSVEDTDPALAAKIANATAHQFVLDIDKQLGRTGSISVAEEAVAPAEPFKPSLRMNLILGVVLGLLVAGAIAVSLEYLDDTIKTPKDLDAFGLKTLGIISHFRRQASAKQGEQDWTAPVMEDFRELRTNIQFVDLESKVKTIVVTSHSQGEGKSTVAANLASVLAQAGERVVLVDADLRRPRLHEILGTRNSFGLTGLLLNDPRDWLSALTRTGFPSMVFLPSGPIPPNPSELLTSKRMADLIAKLKLVTDFIIFDSPPVGTVTDATVLGHAADAVLLVVEPGRTRTESLTETMRSLSTVQSKLIGAVLNKQRKSARKYGYYGVREQQERHAEDLRALLPDTSPR